MPRKRRNPSEEKMAVSRRTRQRTNTNKNTSQSIVISDSESEEGDNGLVQRQDGRSRDREKTKRHRPEMTEEQMLDLAVRMSEQEANQRHEEEEALRKAIEESLCENSVSHKDDQSRPEGVQQNPGNKGKEKMHSTQPDASFPGDSQWESILGNANPKERSPVLVLEKLSQDVVGSCQELGFVACSQECPLTVTPLSAKRTSEGNRLKRKLSFLRTDPVDSYRADGGESSSANLCSGKRRGQQGSTTPQEPETCQHPADAPHLPPVQEKRTCCKTEQNRSPLRMEEDASLNVITLDDFQDSESLLRSSSGPQCLQSGKQSPILLLGSQDVAGSCQEMSSLTCSQSPLTFSPLRSPLPSGNQDSPCPKSPTFPKRKNEGNRLRRTFSRRDTVHRNRADRDESSSADLSSGDGRGKQGSTPPQEPETSWHCAAAPREDSNTPLSCPSTQVATEGAGSMPRGEGAVHYYWGVPFCPQGLNPDDYTKVILCQLEVYEKSLKQAQRGLLRKAEWGEPVLTGPPETPPSRRTRLSRLSKGAGKSRSFQGSQSPRDSEQEGEEEESSQQDKEGRERREEEEEQQEEETSNSQQQAASSAVIRAEGTTETWLNLRRRRGLREERSPREPEEQQEQRAVEDEEEMDLDVCPETQLSEESSQPLLKDSPARTQSLEDVVEKPGSAPVSQRAQRVECPICMQSFPQNRIEMHAAFCDGTRESEELVVEEEEETASQVMSLRRSIRKADSSDAAEPSPSCSDRSAQKEKCYICQDWISVKEYQSHVDNCISRGRNWKSKKLLAALEHSERKDSGNAEVGTSDSFFNHREDGGLVSCLDVEEQEPGSGGDEPACPFQLSDSPIRSYVPISQATDCLVDFKKQLTGPTEGQKRKRKRGRYR